MSSIATFKVPQVQNEANVRGQFIFDLFSPCFEEIF